MDKLVTALDIGDNQDIAIVLTKCAIIKFLGNLGANEVKLTRDKEGCPEN
jgi:hypothetical protein